VAPFLDEAQWTNTLAAVFTLYLVLTGWQAARRRDGQVGRLERWMVFMPVGVLAAIAAATLMGVGKGDPTFGAIYGFAAFSLVALAGDLNLLRQGGLKGPSRTARHIWRISLALFVAAGSYFLGQPKFVPQILKDTGLNFVPPLAVLALLVFWLVRVRLPRRRKPAPQPLAA
jgi:peptidoglycan/LPS O-acetylase OafA/YrhL